MTDSYIWIAIIALIIGASANLYAEIQLRHRVEILEQKVK